VTPMYMTPRDRAIEDGVPRADLDRATRIAYRKRAVTHVHELELRRARGRACVRRQQIGGVS